MFRLLIECQSIGSILGSFNSGDREFLTFSHLTPLQITALTWGHITLEKIACMNEGNGQESTAK